MSILKSINASKAGAEPDTPMLTPEQVVEQLRALQRQIPGFVQLPNDRKLDAIRRRASVNVEFTRAATSAIGASETMEHIIGNSPAEMQAAEGEIGHWAPAVAEAAVTLRGLAAANLLRGERLGLAALQVLNVSRELVRREEHAGLLPHVEAMSRIPKYTRRRKSKPAEPAAPVTKPA